jgi:hypothetical protein
VALGACGPGRSLTTATAPKSWTARGAKVLLRQCSLAWLWRAASWT